MRKWFVLLLLVFSLLVPRTALGQENMKFSSLKVDLWPEYDQPTMLVIYHITLSPQTPVPAQLTIRIPASADLNAVAARMPDGQLLTIEPQSQSSGPWETLSFVATQAQIQIEYYDPNLEKQGQGRSFSFQWPGDYASDATTVTIQQPFNATNLRVSPGPVSTQTGQDGLVYYVKDIGPLSAQQTFKIDIDYQKSSDTLTAENLQVQPSQPLTSQPARTDSLTGILPWALGGMGLVLILGGVYWYWKSGKSEPSTMRRHRSRATRQAAEAPASEGTIYCHQCGKRASSGDRFCRSCGTRLRTE